MSEDIILEEIKNESNPFLEEILVLSEKEQEIKRCMEEGISCSFGICDECPMSY